MNAKETIYAQNWVEQFRYARNHVVTDTPGLWHEGEDIFSIHPSHPHRVIWEGFEWQPTREGSRVWCNRWEDVRDGGLTR